MTLQKPFICDSPDGEVFIVVHHTWVMYNAISLIFDEIFLLIQYIWEILVDDSNGFAENIVQFS